MAFFRMSEGAKKFTFTAPLSVGGPMRFMSPQMEERKERKESLTSYGGRSCRSEEMGEEDEDGTQRVGDEYDTTSSVDGEKAEPKGSTTTTVPDANTNANNNADADADANVSVIRRSARIATLPPKRPIQDSHHSHLDNPPKRRKTNSSVADQKPKRDKGFRGEVLEALRVRVPTATCPFCRQKLDDSKEGALSAHFEGHYPPKSLNGQDNKVRCPWKNCSWRSSGIQFIRHVRGEHLQSEWRCVAHSAANCKWTARRADNVRQHLRRSHKKLYESLTAPGSWGVVDGVVKHESGVVLGRIGEE